MTVWNVDKNAEAKTMVITAEFKASIANVWQLWADPRLLERWWGPPGFPATFEHHDLTPGGTITYFMSGPDGGDHHGLRFGVLVDAPDGHSGSFPVVSLRTSSKRSRRARHNASSSSRR